MIIALEVAAWLLALALAAVLVWGYVRSRNVGFLLLLVGIPVWSILWLLAAPAIDSAVQQTARGDSRTFGELITLVTLTFNLLGSAIVLVGVLFLAKALQSRRRVEWVD